ncbi:MAG: PACE efflux transporter [Gammaproteobacteria bacterium]|nr:PACE efflux transporter [Gammaproteobacteria bacterium]
MSHTERIFHSLLFELVGLGAVSLFFNTFFDKGAGEATLLAVVISLIAMFWNYIYNLGFDYFYSDNRIKRTLAMRVWHSIGFEIGIMLLTLPVLMWALDLPMWTILVMDAGLAVFFILYTFAFNWCYDQLRFWWFNRVEQ